ncbi:MAG: hypothetical protein VX449_03865, partial [Pseudomonadota bacterium]|nr:hypothetical protein [Pseudomonadota bacterium]
SGYSPGCSCCRGLCVGVDANSTSAMKKPPATFVAGGFVLGGFLKSRLLSAGLSAAGDFP